MAGLGAGGFVGYTAGAALDKRTERGLGLTLGLASTAGTIAAANLGGFRAAAALAGGLGVAGAALGNAVFTRLNHTEAHHEAGPQWWNQNRDQVEDI